MRGIERIVAALLLAGAVAGAVVLPRFVGTPNDATRLGIAAPASTTVVEAAPLPAQLLARVVRSAVRTAVVAPHGRVTVHPHASKPKTTPSVVHIPPPAVTPAPTAPAPAVTPAPTAPAPAAPAPPTARVLTAVPIAPAEATASVAPASLPSLGLGRGKSHGHGRKPLELPQVQAPVQAQAPVQVQAPVQAQAPVQVQAPVQDAPVQAQRPGSSTPSPAQPPAPAPAPEAAADHGKPHGHGNNNGA